MFTFVYETFTVMFLVVSETEWAVKSRFDVCKQYAIGGIFSIAENFRETTAPKR